MTRATLISVAMVLALACRTEPEPTRTSTGDPAPSPEPSEPEPEHHLIRHACRGYDAALAEGTAPGQLLSASAKHAIELGGPPVEQASKRWALQPPQALLELIDRYEQDTKPDPAQCAGLRAHLERMSLRSASH